MHLSQRLKVQRSNVLGSSVKTGIDLPPIRMAAIQKTKQVLARMRRNCSPCALVMGYKMVQLLGKTI